MKKESNSDSVEGNIFRTMAYNENQPDNFSSILDWLTSKGDTIGSLHVGTRLAGTGRKLEFKLPFGPNRTVKVETLFPKEALAALLSSKGKEEDDDGAAKDRLAKLEALLKSLIPELTLMEAYSRALPAWQVRNYEVPSWSLTENPSFLEAQRALEVVRREGKVAHLVLSLNPSSSFHSVLSAISLAILFPRSFLLSIILPADPDLLPQLLPISYLVEALNKKGVRNKPMSLFLFESSDQVLPSLLSWEPCGGLLVWEETELLSSSGGLNAGITAAAYKTDPLPARHFILDSSADLKSSLDSLVEEVWCGGVRMVRSLAFVHFPIYSQVTELLEKRLGSLRISEEFRSHNSCDFILRSSPSSSLAKEYEKLIGLGVKMLSSSNTSASAAWRGPTVLYEVGSSVDLVARKVKGGQGHLLFLIPYRSNKELLSLANNHGEAVLTRIFASDFSTIKQLVTAVKGEEIRVNSSGAEGLTSRNPVWLFLQGENKEGEGEKQTQLFKDGFPLAEAEKALKSWTSLSLAERVKVLEKAGLPKGVLSDLLKISAGVANEGRNDWKELKWEIRKPVGIVVLVFPDGNTKTGLSKEALLLTLLVPLIFGNVVIRVGMGVVEPLQLQLPQGLLSTLTIPGNSVKDLAELIRLAGRDEGKVGLFALVQTAGSNTRLPLSSILNQKSLDVMSLTLPPDEEQALPALQSFAHFYFPARKVMM